jgi:16S rRNA (guanine527-N7)-methyltransferase
MFQIYKNDNFDNKTVLDIGAGVGFPSVPFKIVHPNYKLVIYESNQKRVDFLKNVSSQLSLDINVQLIRTEESTVNEKFDLITARAVGSTRILAEISSRILKVNGNCFFLKGPAIQDELLEAKEIMSILNYTYEIIKNNDHNITSKLILLKLTKHKRTPNEYPRD